jgi:hypothetical protein
MFIVSDPSSRNRRYAVLAYYSGADILHDLPRLESEGRVQFYTEDEMQESLRLAKELGEAARAERREKALLPGKGSKRAHSVIWNRWNGRARTE